MLLRMRRMLEMQRQERSQWKGDAIDLVFIVMRIKLTTRAFCINIW